MFSTFHSTNVSDDLLNAVLELIEIIIDRYPALIQHFSEKHSDDFSIFVDFMTSLIDDEEEWCHGKLSELSNLLKIFFHFTTCEKGIVEVGMFIIVELTYNLHIVRLIFQLQSVNNCWRIYWRF